MASRRVLWLFAALLIAPSSWRPAGAQSPVEAEEGPSLVPLDSSILDSYPPPSSGYERMPHQTLRPDPALWGNVQQGPFPTNVWWQNFVLGDGNFTVSMLPGRRTSSSAVAEQSLLMAHRLHRTAMCAQLRAFWPMTFLYNFERFNCLSLAPITPTASMRPSA